MTPLDPAALEMAATALLDAHRYDASYVYEVVERDVRTAVVAYLDASGLERDVDRYRQAREVLDAMVDTLRGVLMVVDQAESYPWDGGALKQQIREDLTAYDLLALDVERAA